uniref:Dockerin domain-containing protein n=1 Tax=candidate division CPR3 bacterium TaxID=2268181 RepID=A0A7C4M262_UNCC3
MIAKKRIYIIVFIFLIIPVSFLGASALQLLNTTLTIVSDSFGLVQWAVPELRVGPEATNDDIDFFLTVRNSSNHAVLFTQPNLVSSDNSGAYLTPINLSGIVPGNYDIGIKSNSHLTKVLRNVNLTSGNNYFNFTQSDNSSTKGPLRLVAGDIDGLGTTPLNSGDDVINSADLSLMIEGLDNEDPTGNNIRANLNQDMAVNSIDLSIILNNLDKEGEK